MKDYKLNTEIMKELKDLTLQEKVWIAFHFDLKVKIHDKEGFIVTFSKDDQISRWSPESVLDFTLQYFELLGEEVFNVNDNLKIELI